jgi:hypothetical protein
MRNAVGGGVSVPSEARTDGDQSIVSDLMTLIVHIKRSMDLLETAIAREAASDGHDPASNIVILDDVTPRYLTANAALASCSAGLGAALHALLDNTASRHGADGFAGRDRRSAALIGRA